LQILLYKIIHYVYVQIYITKFNLILFYTFKINHLYKHLDLYELFGITLLLQMSDPRIRSPLLLTRINANGRNGIVSVASTSFARVNKNKFLCY